MTQREIDQLVKDYIGISGGYLNNFTYRVHDNFYRRYCDLDIDVESYRQRGLTTLNAFIEILRAATPDDQAKIIRGVFEMIPPPDEVKDEIARKKVGLHKQFIGLAKRLESGGTVESPTIPRPSIDRQYYSSRNTSQSLSLVELYSKLLHLYLLFRDRDWFKQKAGITKSNLPEAIKHEAELALPFRLFPITKWPETDITEEHIFDALEFLYDHVSKPGELVEMTSDAGFNHSDYEDYDQRAGREEFRLKANLFLSRYKSGYELNEEGQVLALGVHGLQHILSAEIIPYDETNVDSKVKSAITKWRNRQLDSSMKRDAIRELADVFEWLKKTKSLGTVLAQKDEAAIFDLANNFAIRHHNPRQKSNYDQTIWYSWIFHFYLATYHAVVRMLIKHEKTDE